MENEIRTAPRGLVVAQRAADDCYQSSGTREISSGHPISQEDYAGGVAGFVARARELAAQYGERFEPPASLVAKAEAGETYSDAPALATA